MFDEESKGPMRQGYENCVECHRVCIQLIPHCLHRGGSHAESDHIRMLIDCADICQLCGDYMMRGSEFHGLSCMLCAEICERCADDCERIDANDEHMRRCIEMCRTCAESCREMSAVH